MVVFMDELTPTDIKQINEYSYNHEKQLFF